MKSNPRRWTRSLLISLLLPLCGCALLTGGRERVLARQLDEILNRRASTGAIVTARVVELPASRELYARDCDVPFTPASNMKILVSATGLDMFGFDHTFKTYLAVDGDDLWLIGTGDPAFGDPRLAKRRGATATGVFDE